MGLVFNFLNAGGDCRKSLLTTHHYTSQFSHAVWSGDMLLSAQFDIFQSHIIIPDNGQLQFQNRTSDKSITHIQQEKVKV